MRKNHLYEYLLLFLILISLSVGFIAFPLYRLAISVVIGSVYFLFGIFSHLEEKTLHFKIVLEYLAISLLGTIILIFISLRA